MARLSARILFEGSYATRTYAFRTAEGGRVDSVHRGRVLLGPDTGRQSWMCRETWRTSSGFGVQYLRAPCVEKTAVVDEPRGRNVIGELALADRWKWTKPGLPSGTASWSGHTWRGGSASAAHPLAVGSEATWPTPGEERRHDHVRNGPGPTGRSAHADLREPRLSGRACLRVGARASSNARGRSAGEADADDGERFAHLRMNAVDGVTVTHTGSRPRERRWSRTAE